MTNGILVVLLIVVFTAVLAVGQGLYWAYIGRQEQKLEALKRRLGQTGEDAIDEESLFRSEEADVAATALGGMGAHIRQLITSSDSEYSTTAFLARVIVAFGIGLVGGGIASGSPMGMLLGFPAALIPYVLLRRAASVRTEHLVSQIPDSLDLMARSLQAGVGLSDAFKLVAEEMPMPIAAEFGRVFEEVRFGRDLREAFDKLLERNPGVFDLRLFCSSVLLQRETGGNLIEILNNISHTIRQRFVFHEKVLAMTSEAKFTALLLGALPIFVLVVLAIMNPNYMGPMFSDLIGNFILLIAFVMYCIGGFLMYEVSRVEV